MTEIPKLAHERQERVVAFVNARGMARIQELVEAVAASAATVRRDLMALEQQGRLRRVYGGATALEARIEEPLFDDKTSLAAPEKRRIAEAAATHIEKGDVVYLDGGSTVLELARRCASRSDIMVVTNSLRAAEELSGRGPKMMLIGGELRRLSQTCVGPMSRFLLDQIRVDKAFMGTMGIALPEGLTTSDANEAFTKSLVMSRATQVFVLADHTKAGRVTFARSGDLTAVHTVITDDQFPVHLAKSIKKLGVECVRV